MATLKQIRRRIRSVQSTRQITKAMEMVAAAKLRKAQVRAAAAEPYALALREALDRLSASGSLGGHPLLERRPDPRTLLCVVGSDRGLCGGFNAGVTRLAEQRLAALGPQRVRLQPVGGRVARYYAYRGWEFADAAVAAGDQVDPAMVGRLTRLGLDLFLGGEIDRVEFLYTRFLTTARRALETETVIPVALAEPDPVGTPYLCEPDAARVLAALLPRHVETRVLSILASSFAAEHSARMLAMGNATRNADDVMTELTLKANKVRQAVITKELLEIVGGAEGLA